MINIVLIGAGQLGSRHLQGLSKLQFPAIIYVVDPNVYSLESARSRYYEMEKNPFITEILLKVSLDDLPKQIELVIIATSSDVRAALIKQVLAKCDVRNLILEKVLFQKENDYYEIAQLTKAKNVNVWVNCPRRLFDGYIHLKKYFAQNEPVFLSVTGGNWGLGCNSIHYVDLLAFITEDYSIEFDTHLLSNDIFESKRSGFKEFSGTLIGRQKNGSTIILNAEPKYNGKDLITVRGKNIIAVVDEVEGKINIATEKGQWKWEEEKLTIKYQSQVTGILASEIISTGSCGLVSFENSLQLHVPFIKALLNFHNNVFQTNLDACPIT